MSWIDAPRATFDLETTGVDVTTARIVTFAASAEPGWERAASWRVAG